MIWLSLLGCTSREEPAGTETTLQTPPTNDASPTEGDADSDADSDSDTDTDTDTGSPSTGSTADTAPEGAPVLIGVGYGGLRIVSRDGGLTWGDRAAFGPSGGDDYDLLRAIAYGDGLWISTGWRFVTSTDGVEWTDHGRITDDPDLPSSCVIIEALTWANGVWYSACDGDIYRSEDGFRWEFHAHLGGTGSHMGLDWHEGTFATYGDTGRSFTSTDAEDWTEVSLDRITWCEGEYRSLDDCEDSSWFDGAYYRTRWPDRIERSTDGDDWETVYQDPEENSLYRPRALASGLVPL